MVWIPPKLDWKSVDGVLDADLNRIEGNILDTHDALQLTEYVIPADSMRFWIDSVNGLDTNPGTFELPLKTLQAGVNKIPGRNSTATLYLAEGDYESLYSIHKVITIKSNDAAKPAVIKQSINIRGGRITLMDMIIGVTLFASFAQLNSLRCTYTNVVPIIGINSCVTFNGGTFALNSTLGGTGTIYTGTVAGASATVKVGGESCFSSLMDGDKIIPSVFGLDTKLWAYGGIQVHTSMSTPEHWVNIMAYQEGSKNKYVYFNIDKPPLWGLMDPLVDANIDMTVQTSVVMYSGGISEVLQQATVYLTSSNLGIYTRSAAVTSSGPAEWSPWKAIGGEKPEIPLPMYDLGDTIKSVEGSFNVYTVKTVPPSWKYTAANLPPVGTRFAFNPSDFLNFTGTLSHIQLKIGDITLNLRDEFGSMLTRITGAPPATPIRFELRPDNIAICLDSNETREKWYYDYLNLYYDPVNGVTLYVNDAIGNDNNVGKCKSASYPVRTAQAAFDSLPKCSIFPLTSIAFNLATTSVEGVVPHLKNATSADCILKLVNDSQAKVPYKNIKLLGADSTVKVEMRDAAIMENIPVLSTFVFDINKADVKIITNTPTALMANARLLRAKDSKIEVDMAAWTFSVKLQQWMDLDNTNLRMINVTEATVRVSKYVDRSPIKNNSVLNVSGALYGTDTIPPMGVQSYCCHYYYGPVHIYGNIINRCINITYDPDTGVDPPKENPVGISETYKTLSAMAKDLACQSDYFETISIKLVSGPTTEISMSIDMAGVLAGKFLYINGKMRKIYGNISGGGKGFLTLLNCTVPMGKTLYAMKFDRMVMDGVAMYGTMKADYISYLDIANSSCYTLTATSMQIQRCGHVLINSFGATGLTVAPINIQTTGKVINLSTVAFPVEPIVDKYSTYIKNV